jgi:hypothetical protein
MFGFFKGKESAKVRQIRASRIKYIDPDHSEVHIEFRAEDKSLPSLVLELTPTQTRALIGDLTAAYDAINPPLYRGTHESTWQGME